MLKELVRGFRRDRENPCSPVMMGAEFKVQRISMGKSPLGTMQKPPAISPVLAGASFICGYALVDTAMKRTQGINIQETRALIQTHQGETIFAVYNGSRVEGPAYLQGQISLGHHTIGTGNIAHIGGRFAETKGQHLWRHLNGRGVSGKRLKLK